MAFVGRRRVFFLLASATLLIIYVNWTLLQGAGVRSKIDRIFPKKTHKKHEEVLDKHPIRKLMKAADALWADQEDNKSVTFRETVNKYRRKNGRHPPPGFDKWYRYARDRNVHNIDDFDQIMDDLRPFWGVEPQVIRSLAANMHRVEADGISGIHIRDGKITESNSGWRSEALVSLIQRFVDHLPNMDIAMNRLDQPRVVVPWDDLQILLAKEESSRKLPPDSSPDWTKDMSGFFSENAQNLTIEDPGWFGYGGKQYMDLAREACPPESHARDPDSTTASSEALYKDHQGGIITNFNRSTDLCTVGPELQGKHGMLYSASSITASRRLIPVFGECKVSVNNDILFPANMYWKHDDRYDYDGKHDLDWDDKEDIMIWRGVTSGGTQLADNWRTMHRQRLVLIVNGTEMKDEEIRILRESPHVPGEYENFAHFRPSKFAYDHTDVGFVEAWGCIPDCSFYNDVWTMKPQISLGEQFKYKYVVDVDGHSFSGRWHAFLQSKSLGIKSTIFREWHDSRLIAWRHFVPMDNRYDDVYTLLTYFIGLGNLTTEDAANLSGDQPLVRRHEFEAEKIAKQSREWASKALRREDIEIYMFRLLLEYARIIDDNRERIGYSGDGSEMDKYDSKNPMIVTEGRW